MHTVLEDLDIELMKQGARLFEGRHHFGSYCTKPGPKTCLERNIRVCRIEENTEFQAIEMVQSLNPDVVLMDVNMPGMNGIQTTRKILKKHPDVRIIGLSINAEEEVSEALFAAGAKAYLSKDGLPSELIKQIRKKS